MLSRSRAARHNVIRTSAPPLMQALEQRALLATVGGVDPSNLGKGDWVYQVSATESATRTTSVQGLVDYLKAKGLKWIAVKAGDGNNGPNTSFYTQFNKDLIDRVHAAGMKIFAYHFVYGGLTPNSRNAPTTVDGEKAVMKSIMALNPDGLIIDAETDWNKLANAGTVALDYGKTFKTLYPTKLLGHAPPAYISANAKFPYQDFGKYADVVMPQMYWRATAAGTPQQIVSDIDAEWKKLYNTFATTGHSDSVKPLVPKGQGYDISSSNPTPGDEVADFFTLLRNDTDPASPFGYNGVGFWSAQNHNADVWAAIGAGVSGAPTGSISGSIYNDANADGIRNFGETGLAGRVVYLDQNNNGVFDGYEAHVTTDGNGNYTLPKMRDGTLHVRTTTPSGYRATVPSAAAGLTLTISKGSSVSSANFGFTQLAMLSGNVFNDADGNGLKGSVEGNLSGWRVFIDANKNGLFDTGERSALTNSLGNYTMNLPAGSIRLALVPAGGYRITTPGLGYYDLALGSGQQLSKSFGATTSVLISGFVFNDANGNGIRDAGEVGLSGWRVFIDKDFDGVFDSTEPSALTDSSGKFRFSQLPAGTYYLRVLQPAGWKLTVPSTGYAKVTIASGKTISNRLFGEKKL